jgi:hypothetical protein
MHVDHQFLFDKSSEQFFSLICDESLTCRGTNSNPRHFGLFYLYLCLCRESRLLISWGAGDRCGMTDNDDDRVRSRRPGAQDRG